MKITQAVVLFFAILAGSFPARSLAASSLATPVVLQNATATFSQYYSGDFSIGRTIDGQLYDNYGWAVLLVEA